MTEAAPSALPAWPRDAESMIYADLTACEEAQRIMQRSFCRVGFCRVGFLRGSTV
jgi:hypothetical protein